MKVNCADRRIGITGMGLHLPAARRSNAEVARSVGVSPEWIVRRTGVRERRVAAPGEASSDLAAEAVRRAVRAAGISQHEVGLLVLATSTPDELGPATACRVQALTGTHHAVALDVTAACSGWLFGCRVAHDWLRADPAVGHAVVVGVETYSRFLDPHDRGTAALFADGAAAAVLGPVPDGGFTGFRLGSDGRGAHHVLIPAGGSRLPASGDTVREGGHTVHMDGRAVRDFIADIFPKLVQEALREHRLRLEDIDLFVPHQPNPVLVREVAQGIGIPPERLAVFGQDVGNIGAASTPYALASAAAQGRLRAGDRVLLSVFGAGLTWGSAVLTWTGAVCLPARDGQTPVDETTPAPPVGVVASAGRTAHGGTA